MFTSTVEMFPTLGASNLGSKNYARCNNSRCHDKIFFSVFWPEVRLLARHGSRLPSLLVCRFAKLAAWRPSQPSWLTSLRLAHDEVRDQIAQIQFRLRRGELLAADEYRFGHLLSQMTASFQHGAKTFGAPIQNGFRTFRLNLCRQVMWMGPPGLHIP